MKKLSHYDLIGLESGETAALHYLLEKDKSGLTRREFYANYSVKSARVDELIRMGLIDTNPSYNEKGYDEDNYGPYYRLSPTGRLHVVEQLFAHLRSFKKISKLQINEITGNVKDYFKEELVTDCSWLKENGYLEIVRSGATDDYEDYDFLSINGYSLDMNESVLIPFHSDQKGYFDAVGVVTYFRQDDTYIVWDNIHDEYYEYSCIYAKRIV